MNVIGAVTAGAAGLAAALAAVNLYVSGQREQNRWLREALIETLVTFLNASFEHSAICRTASLPISSTEPEREHLHGAVVAAHDLESEAMTRMRLLAPFRLVTAAEELHETEHAMATLCLAIPLPGSTDLDDSRVQVRAARAQLLEAARRVLRLHGAAPINDRNEGTWDEFRSSISAYPTRTGTAGRSAESTEQSGH